MIYKLSNPNLLLKMDKYFYLNVNSPPISSIFSNSFVQADERAVKK